MLAIENIFVKYIKLRNKLDNAKIYKIVDNTNDDIYIGSTCDSLKRRLTNHKCDYKCFLKGLRNNIKSFDILKNDDYKIELLEACEVKTKDELLARERYFIENNECINKNIPGRTIKEYYIDNKDKIKEYKKAYYIDNKDKIKEYKKAYRDTNKEKINEKFDCECGGHFTYSHKSRHIKSAKHQKKLNSNL